MTLLRSSPVPLYQQAADAMREKVRSGQWPRHYRLKSESALMQEFGLSRGTVRQALRVLIDEGLLTSVQGRGTFVTASVADLPLAQRFVTMHEVLAESGQEHTTEVLGQEVLPAPERVRTLLDLAADEPVLHLRRRRLVEGEPLVALENFVRLTRCPQLERVDFTQTSLFHALEHDCGLQIGSGQRSFGARRADEIAPLLAVGPDEPVLYLSQVTYLSDGQPLENSDVWVRGDQLRVTTILHR